MARTVGPLSVGGHDSPGISGVPVGPAQRPRLATLVGGGMTTTAGYQYVVLRCVPRVDREEFVNVGVVVYSQAADYLCAAARVDRARRLWLAAEVEPDAVQASLDAIVLICCGDESAGAVARTTRSQR